MVGDDETSTINEAEGENAMEIGRSNHHNNKVGSESGRFRISLVLDLIAGVSIAVTFGLMVICLVAAVTDHIQMWNIVAPIVTGLVFLASQFVKVE